MSGNDRSSWDPEAQKKQVSARPQGRNFLLLIGIDTYDHFPRLENARRDTEAFRDLLQRKYQFEPDHTIELFDDQATRRNILRTLDGLTEQLTSDDNLLIYYAGHGYHRKRLNIGYFVPSEAETGAFEMLISNTTIRDYVRAFDAHHILLIVDSCFSGSLLHRDAEMVKAFAEKVDQFSSRWGLAAGMIEKVADGTVGSHSPFAKSLLHYLEQNTAPRLPISELIQYVSKITTYNADQTPIGGVLEQTEHLGGQFVFDLKVDESRDWAEAQATKDLPAYQKYLEAWPIGKHAEAGYWRIACLTDTATAYDLYLDRYPRGKWATEANEKLHLTETLANWGSAQNRDTLSAYRDFLRKHPRSVYVKQAQLRLVELRQGDEDLVAWEEACATATLDGYEAYLDGFPNGIYALEAHKLIVGIQTQAEKRKKEAEAAKQRREAKKRRKTEEQVKMQQRVQEVAEQQKIEEEALQKKQETADKRLAEARITDLQKNKYKTELKWGGIIAFISLLGTLIMINWFSFEDQTGLSFLFWGAYLVLFSIALWEKRKNDLGGSMVWKEGFSSGLIITLVYTIFVSLGNLFIYGFLFPDYFDQMAAHMAASSPSQEATSLSNLTLLNMTILGAISIFIQGGIIAAIAAFFMQRKTDK